MKDTCLWNDEAKLHEQAARLEKQGLREAAQGCRDRAAKVKGILSRFGEGVRAQEVLREPVEAFR